MKKVQLLIVVLILVVSNQLSAQNVYVTNTGEKYHKSSCRYLKNSKKEIALDKAKSQGFTACKVCKPTGSSAVRAKSTSSTSKRTTAVQCSGRTNSGARCKRKTKNASGRCYQHL